VRLEDDPAHPDIEVIGGGQPIGLCGNRLHRLPRPGRVTGVIQTNGRYESEALARGWVQRTEHARVFTVGTPRQGTAGGQRGGHRQLLQAKAAIAAGILCLLDRVGLQSQDVETLYLAGGFVSTWTWTM